MATPSIPDTSFATAVTARVNGERLVLLGWSRAILMQMSHPLVAAGVAGHSAFRANPIASARRLHHTVRAMLALTFGSDVERARPPMPAPKDHRGRGPAGLITRGARAGDRSGRHGWQDRVRRRQRPGVPPTSRP